MKSYELEPYQRLSTHFLRNNSVAALYMGCGMGKTLSCLDVLKEDFLEGACRGVLVVAPKRVANITWPEELEQFDEFADLSITSLRGARGEKAYREGRHHIYTINYESLHKLYELVEKYDEIPFDTVIFDELTKTKGLKSYKATKNNSKRLVGFMKLLFPHVERRWGLTGTPLGNSLFDIYGQTLILDGGLRLGKSFSSFRDKYFYVSDPYKPHDYKPFPGSEQRIYELLSDMCLSLRREEWLDLPAPIIEDIPVALEKSTRDLYETLKKKKVASYKGNEIVADTAALLVQKLSQITSGAIYFKEEDEEFNITEKTIRISEAKLNELKKLHKKYDEPLLVGCNFRHEQIRIREAFPDAFFVADWKGEKKERQLSEMWNTNQIKMLVGNPLSMGHGLNLQKGLGRRIVWFTLPWSSELEEQFNFRLSRKGQKQDVYIHRLIVPNSIDEAILATLRVKKDNQEFYLKTIENLNKLF